jgi:hypothetical protein
MKKTLLISGSILVVLALGLLVNLNFSQNPIEDLTINELVITQIADAESSTGCNGRTDCEKGYVMNDNGGCCRFKVDNETGHHSY